MKSQKFTNGGNKKEHYSRHSDYKFPSRVSLFAYYITYTYTTHIYTIYGTVSINSGHSETLIFESPCSHEC